ncbi:MAG: insulinase family protein [Meiothermus sp.]|uniref:M16 family metallopeptidase n=1 Tax=Meiothermus sp. TaxID=1955249 RepID=UPI0025FE821E|nr:insulinase family protein [Meiothermus sp.]MDW8217565.1 insulinase family protein [Acidobacteriota bacterium]MCS7057412.1 insulinase family protein [Meiothermus sp.]MCS7193520.1 insulinase family protein [Meiothermus sp.]MCX7739961.1 insulinase family protein [Meiothermus sp.]MDW8090196.1 insulinase family protein [Meiothermus sp.]
MRPAIGLLFLVLLLPGALAQRLKDEIRRYTLDNGLRVLMVPDRTAPVIHFNLMFDVGGVDEAPGLGGIAHMVEHMAFKGTPSIGSLDWPRERAALEAVDKARAELDQALARGAPQSEVDRLTQAFNQAREEAKKLALPNAIDQLFTNNGEQGLNASTGYDRTDYRVSLPSNRLELYLRVYADVMMNAVFRSFYEEVDVVLEERRQRNENDPNGALNEVFLRAAFQVHPYGRPLIGSREEILGYRVDKAMEFWKTHYHPNRAVLVLVGDVEPERDIALVRRYLGAVPRGPERPNLDIPAEPPQTAERRVTLEYNAQPSLRIGFHKPTYPSRDAYVMDMIDAILTEGRTSRLFRRLVIQEQAALNVSSSSASPGFRYPNLFVISAQPRAPRTTQDLERLIYDELERLKNEPVSPQELQRVRNQTRAAYLRVLQGGPGLAQTLAFYELFFGGYERIFEEESIYNTITPEEIQQAARKYFTPENRTVATLVTKGGSR